MSKTKLFPTKNTLPEDTRRKMVEMLNQQLADSLDLEMQTKQAHWNVKGPHFIGLHELFDKVHEEVEKFTDEIAERATSLGGIVAGTIQAVEAHSRLTPYPLNLTAGKEHVEAISSVLAEYGKSTNAAIDTATKAEDTGTADMLTDVIRAVDKLMWMVESHAISEG